METKIVDTDDPVHSEDSQPNGEKVAAAGSFENINDLRKVRLRQVGFLLF